MRRYAAFICLFLACILGSVLSVCVDGELYFKVQQEAGILRHTDANAVRQMNGDVCAYLSEKADIIPNVTERAMMHMADVRNLVRAARAAAVCLLAMFLLLVIRIRVFSGWKALIALASPLCAVAMIGLIFMRADFHALFMAFHELFFTNDLWILDPGQDLLIRILPEEFFLKMALATGKRTILAYAVVCSAVILLANARVKGSKGKP